MKKPWYIKVVAAVLSCSLLITCAGVDTALAAALEKADAEESYEDTESPEAEPEESEEDLETDDAATDNISDPEPVDEEPSGTDLPADQASEDEYRPRVKDIALPPSSERIIYVEHKGSESDAIAELPGTWEVVLEDGSTENAGISWECVDDFYDDSYTSFVFRGRIDDEDVSWEQDDEDPVMEIYFADAAKAQDNGTTAGRLSPNTLMTGLGDEQGTAGYTESFLNAYGSDADNVISADLSYSASGSVLSSTAYNVFKGISPTPDNYLYNTLNADEKRFYNNIDSVVAQHLYYGKEMSVWGSDSWPVSDFIPSGGLGYDGMLKVFEIYYYDNPQAFFITKYYFTAGGTGQDLSMALTFLPDADTPKKIKSKAEKIAKNISTLSKTVNKQSNEYEKAKKAQSLLCKRISVDPDMNFNDKDWKNWTVGSYRYNQSLISVFYGSDKKSQSGGYAKAYTALLRLAGIGAFDISSDITNGYQYMQHEWNKVRLYGEWFCVDPIADDTDALSGAACTYNYFMKSDDTIKKNEGYTWASLWTKVAPKSSRNFDSKKIKKYSIKYHLSGGTNSIYNMSAYTAKAGTITLHSPKRAGYEFKGWYTDDGYHDKITKIKGSEKKNYDLYAKWSVVKYKITYHNIKKTDKNPNKNRKEYTVSTQTIKLKDAKRTGYRFKGWYTSSSFAPKSKITQIKKGSTGNKKLYAKWEAINYKITYRLAGDVVNTGNPATYTIATKTIKLKAPTRAGYVFGGWYTNKSLAGKYKITKIKGKDQKNYILYAKWTKK